MEFCLPSTRILSFLLVGACVAAAASCSAGASNNGSGLSTSSAGNGGASGSSGTTGTGAGDCMGCVTSAACGAGRDCAQFAGDTYCATDCTNGAACPSGHACMPINTAEGVAASVCIPVTNPCGVTMSTTGSASASSSTSASSSGSGTCAHSICTAGTKLTTGCDPCATQVCAGDSYCCATSWDADCVNEVASICGESCSGSSSSTSGSTSA